MSPRIFLILLEFSFLDFVFTLKMPFGFQHCLLPYILFPLFLVSFLILRPFVVLELPVEFFCVYNPLILHGLCFFLSLLRLTQHPQNFASFLNYIKKITIWSSYLPWINGVSSRIFTYSGAISTFSSVSIGYQPSFSHNASACSIALLT